MMLDYKKGGRRPKMKYEPGGCLNEGVGFLPLFFYSNIFIINNEYKYFSIKI